jgi:Ca2+-binding EF-hand superfamily protein
VEEFLAIYSQAKKDKDTGNIEDFKEVLKLYDKSEDGTMFYDELKHILMTMGKLRDKTGNDKPRLS